MRVRDIGLTIGELPTGPRNAITDVDGVGVGHSTIIRGEGRMVVGEGPVRTGVTVVRATRNHPRQTPVVAGTATLNGNGEMTGLEWVRESGLLTSDIGITNTHSVGIVRDALVAEDEKHNSGQGIYWSMPVVGETYDGLLNDIEGRHVKAEHVEEAIANLSYDVVGEGAVGGGTGMICHGFKGGIGTSSRVVTIGGKDYTVGVLVQANYGDRKDLRFDGLTIGRHLGDDVVPMPNLAAHILAKLPKPGTGSIILIIATDAPLTDNQCRRLANRCYVGLSRNGGGNHDGSGDIAIAFATGNVGKIPAEYMAIGEFTPTYDVTYLAHQVIDPLFYATTEATEEAIFNAMLQAETVEGRDWLTAQALTPEALKKAIADVRDGLTGVDA